MPLVSMKEMLETAVSEGYAVGQYNLNNLEWTQAILKASQAERAPLICGVSESAAKYMGGYKCAVNIVTALMEEYEIDIPVAIHLDHGGSFEECVKAMKAGFTSVMIDASKAPLEENIAETKRVVDVAHVLGVSVEAELGRIAGTEDDMVVDEASGYYAVPDECVRLAEETGLDVMAPALGSVHGPYKGKPQLGFKQMKEIRERTNLPLVLHGGSGIPEDDIKKAISCGIAKINVNTENQMTFVKRVKEIFAEKPDLYDPRKYLGPAAETMQETVKAKIREFGTSGKA